MERLEGKKVLNDLSKSGFINYTEDENGVKVEINAHAVLNLLQECKDIPLPKHKYEELKKIETDEKDFIETLPVVLAVMSEEYERVGQDVNKITGEVKNINDDLSTKANIISTFYDLENPYEDNNCYWFKVDEEIVEKYEELAKTQDENDFITK